MADEDFSFKVEVSGIRNGIDEVALSCLLESKRKMGRSINVVDVTFNPERGAALVTLGDRKDVQHVINISSQSLSENILRFCKPDEKLWKKSTVCVHNVPSHVTEEEIFLRFESKRSWGRELDVESVYRPRKDRLYITFNKERDANYVAEKRLVEMFGVQLQIDNPGFQPVCDEEYDYKANAESDYLISERMEIDETNSEVTDSGLGLDSTELSNLNLDQSDVELSQALEASFRKDPLRREVLPEASVRAVDPFDVFSSVEAVLSSVVIPSSDAIKEQWLYNLKSQFPKIETLILDKHWMLRGSWSDMEEVRHCLTLWYTQYQQTFYQGEPRRSGGLRDNVLPNSNGGSDNFLTGRLNSLKINGENSLGNTGTDRENRSINNETERSGWRRDLDDFSGNKGKIVENGQTSRQKDGQRSGVDMPGRPSLTRKLASVADMLADADSGNSDERDAPRQRTERSSGHLGLSDFNGNKRKDVENHQKLRGRDGERSGAEMPCSPSLVIKLARKADKLADPDSSDEVDAPRHGTKSSSSHLRSSGKNLLGSQPEKKEQTLRVKSTERHGDSATEDVGPDLEQFEINRAERERIESEMSALEADFSRFSSIEDEDESRENRTNDKFPTHQSEFIPDAPQVSQSNTGSSASSPLLKCTLNRGVDIFVYKSDITRIKVGAIVNAANQWLQHGGGLAAIISKVAGPEFQKASEYYVKKRGKIPIGSVAVLRASGHLMCKHVINAVGPTWGEFARKDQCKRVLMATFLKCFKCANEECKVRELAVPLISSGIYRVPVKVVAEALFLALLDFDLTTSKRSSLKEIHIVDVNEESLYTLVSVLHCKFRGLVQ